MTILSRLRPLGLAVSAIALLGTTAMATAETIVGSSWSQIIRGTDGADKIVADSRSEQGGQIVRHIVSRGVDCHGASAGRAGMNEFLEPGMIVEHPAEPDRGRGKVQSPTGMKHT